MRGDSWRRRVAGWAGLAVLASAAAATVTTREVRAESAATQPGSTVLVAAGSAPAPRGLDAEPGATTQAGSATQAGSTVVVSGDRHGAILPGRSYGPAMSADGRWVAFESDSTVLPTAAGAGHGQVYLRDMRSGDVELISATSSGGGADGESYAPSVSGDGRWVAFVSEADDLAAATTTGPVSGTYRPKHVYLRDRVAHTTRRLDLSRDGRSLINGDSPAVSADGRWVVYNGGVPEVSNGTGDDQDGIFVYDVRTDRRERIPRVEGDDPSISGDGRYVVFSSEVRDLVPGDTNRKADCFRYDRRTHRIDLISADEAGREGDDESTGAVISSDGNWVVFASSAHNLTGHQPPRPYVADRADLPQVYLRDLRTGRVRLVSAAAGGKAANQASGGASLSADGRWVVYLSEATDLPAPPAAGRGEPVEHVYRWDSHTGRAAMVDVTPQAHPADGAASSFPAISADGARIAFGSRAADLVPGAGGGHDAIYQRRWATEPNPQRPAGPGRPPVLFAPVPGAHSWPPVGDDSNSTPTISPDGRWVAFASRATNLVPGLDNHKQNVFVLDTRSGAVRAASVASNGDPGNADSADPSISADGRWVVFDSFANNLVAGSRSRSGVVYLHDMTTGSTVRVSVAMGGAEPDGQSGLSRISSDGRWVAFESVADDLVPGRPSRSQVYVWDRTTGVTSLVSTDWFGNAGDAGSGDAAISADGRYVAFDSPADNLVPGSTVTPGVAEVYVRDRTLGTIVLVSRHTSAIGDDSSSHPSISADGHFVAFESRATNLIASNPLLPATGDQSGGAEPHVLTHVYLHDMTTSVTTEVDLSTRGVPAQSDSYSAALSPDGHAVAFVSLDHSLVPGASHPQPDVYLRDLTAGTTTRISSAPDTAQAVGTSRTPAIDSDGGVVVFVSEAPVAGPANPDGDLYRRDTRHGRTTRMT
ncbi:MAG TPA: hypothetical protein VHV82_10525 [Sporichthyaceae bacterium]|nr:hypothetical protein [Sporichthyaceae bacterium]